MLQLMRMELESNPRLTADPLEYPRPPHLPARITPQSFGLRCVVAYPGLLALNLPFILVACPGADGEEGPGFRDRWMWTYIPAQPLTYGEAVATVLNLGSCIHQVGIILPALRAGWKDWR